MNKKISKTTAILSILMVSAFLVPSVTSMADAQGFSFETGSMSDAEMAQMPSMMSGYLANIFAGMSFLGPSGAALGEVFAILFENLLNITSFEPNTLDSVYMLNASYEDKYNSWTQDYGQSGYTEQYWLQKSKYDDIPGIDGYPYIEVAREGNMTVEYTAGASVVFLMWDNDLSLINTIDRIVKSIRTVTDKMEAYGDPNGWTDEQSQDVIETMISEVLSSVTYLLFHINDIITGDELIITNIITWETWNTTYSDGWSASSTLKQWTQSDPDEDISGLESAVISEAQSNGDDYAVYLLDTLETETTGQSKEWSTFSFNLVELWLKNFEIHINAQAIADGLAYVISEGVQGEELDPETGIAEIFQGLDIEMYLMTHSLFAWVGYNDENNDLTPTVDYETIVEGDTEWQAINDTEIEYWFALKDFDNPTFNQPQEITTEDGKEAVQWNFEMANVQVYPVPIGMSPGDALATSNPEEMETVEMGFTFIPDDSMAVTTEGYQDLQSGEETVQMGAGIIKLDQTFGEWNDGLGLNNPTKLAGLDFAVLFISTMLYFHVNINVEAIEEQTNQTAGLANESSWSAEGTIKVGNYEQTLPVAAVDIVGPEYDQGGDLFQAKTSLIPLVMMDYNMAGSMQYIDEQTPTQSFSADGYLEIEASVMIYAVSYHSFSENAGEAIVHDPTFSVFMQWDNPGFWAVILVVGSVTLVAVAAILITKKKNRV